MIPLSVMALCTVKLEIESNIEIDERNAIFLPGGEVNIKMKQLAGDNTSLSTKGYNFQNQSIMAIKSSLVEPDESKKQNNNVVSTTDSPYPIYMWYEEGNIYWWSEASRPSLNEDASNMFRSFTNLEDIADLARIDAKNSTTIQTMFTDNLGLETLHGLENWDTSNISNITGIFALNTSVYNAGYRSKLKDITALQNWNISKVTNLNQIFLNQNALIDLRGLENWDTSNVTSMQSTFGLMKGVSKDNNDIVDLTPLAKWDTSNVIYMNTLFQNVNLLSYEPLANWQTGNVQNFSNTFNQSDYSTTTSLKGLENWDVSSAKTLETMFLENVSLISADSINNWNVNATMNFTHMFRRTPVHPNFTKLPGIWDGYGTLIPNT